MSDSHSSEGLEQLQEAVERFLAWRRDEPDVTADEFLARHPAMRELLVPMIEDAQADTGNTTSDAEAALGRTRFGDFELHRELGRGGMGVVYEARQISLDRQVALKLMPAAFAQDPKAIARFRREARTAARLRHSGIVRVLQVGLTEEVPWYAMELVEGLPLHRVMRLVASRTPKSGWELAEIVGQEVALLHSGARDSCEAAKGKVEERSEAGPPLLSTEPSTRTPSTSRAATTKGSSSGASCWRDGLLETFVELSVQLCDALAHAHEAGVVHRDVKPSNLLLRPDGSLVLTDFGLARDFGLPSATLTGEFAGTPHYVSPEQADGKTTEVGPASDVFSAGATIYELLTRERAFDGDSPQVVIEKIRREDPRDPSSTGLVPADIAAILLKSLEKDPARRYADAGQLADDLRAFRSFRPVTARRPNTIERLRRIVRRKPLETSLLSAFLIVGLLVGYVWRTNSLRDVGRSVLRAQEIERLLEDSLIALMHTESSNPEAAAKLDRVLEADPHNSIAYFAKGFWVGDSPMHEFRDRVARAVAGRPRDSALRRVLALAHLHTGNRDKFLELREAVGPSVSAVDYFIESLAHAPRFGGSGQEDKYRRAAQAALDSVVRAPRVRLIYHYFWALAASRSDDEAMCRRAAGATLAVWPNDARAMMVAGIALSFVEPKRGEALLRGAVEADPTLEKAWINLAIVIGHQGRNKEALDVTERALRIDPRLATAWSLRGLQLKKLGQIDEAVASTRKAVELLPRNAFYRHQLAAMLERAGDRPAAIREAGIAARYAPRYEKVHSGLLKMNEILGDHAAVRREHERWCKANPNGAWAFAQFAEWLLRQPDVSNEDAQLALQHTHRAVRLFTTDCWLWIIRAQALARVNQGDAARQALDRAESFLPKDDARERRRLGRGIRRLRRQLGS